MRKLVAVLLSGIICLLGVSLAFAQDIKIYTTLADYEKLTGKKIEKFSEAPMLKTMVAAGELPLLEERLPEEPLVVEPLEEIGQYGGTLHIAPVGRLRDIRQHGLFMRSQDGTKIVPDIAKGYEYSKDYKTLTIYLRKGVKWSDGVPFTVDDILFWWEDIAKNEQLAPGGEWGWKAGGEGAEFEKVDDYTLRIHFSAPNPSIMPFLSHPHASGQTHFFNPKHYLKKWHIKYNPEADELAKEEGYEHWWQALRYHEGSWQTQRRENLPTLCSYVVTKVTSSYSIAERNPYFWQVDTAGNQLPYIDKVWGLEIDDPDVIIMKAISGELDFAAGYEKISMEDYPFCKEYEEKGDYRVLLYKDFKAEAGLISVNSLTPDPVLRKIFRDIRFRQALSLGIDREAINDSVFFGLAVPRQFAPLPNASFYKEEWGKYYAEHDPGKANALLDEMGLKWDSEHKWRLRPDGKILDVLIESLHGSEQGTTIHELVKEQWKELGIKLTIKTGKCPFERQKGDLCELISDCVTGTGQADIALGAPEAYHWGLGVGWEHWLKSNGKEGVEPPDEWKELKKWCDNAVSILPNTEEWIHLKQKIWDFRIKQLWVIGIVDYNPVLDLARNYVRNIPEEGWLGWDSCMWVANQPQQWFIKK